MFFVLSKVLWIAAAPTNLLLGLAVLGAAGGPEEGRVDVVEVDAGAQRADHERRLALSGERAAQPLAAGGLAIGACHRDDRR